jgi:hypothetical protein
LSMGWHPRPQNFIEFPWVGCHGRHAQAWNEALQKRQARGQHIHCRLQIACSLTPSTKQFGFNSMGNGTASNLNRVPNVCHLCVLLRGHSKRPDRGMGADTAVRHNGAWSTEVVTVQLTTTMKPRWLARPKSHLETKTKPNIFHSNHDIFGANRLEPS